MSEYQDAGKGLDPHVGELVQYPQWLKRDWAQIKTLHCGSKKKTLRVQARRHQTERFPKSFCFQKFPKCKFSYTNPTVSSKKGWSKSAEIISPQQL